MPILFLLTQFFRMQPLLKNSSPTFAVSAVCCHDDHQRERRCRYQVAWSINPHMRVGSVDFKRAHDQHRSLRNALLRAGAQLINVPFVHAAYDSVFVKDSAVLVQRGENLQALLCMPRFSQRRSEQLTRAATFYRLGFTVHEPPSVPLEGGDVVMLPDGGALLGYGLRSDLGAVACLEKLLGAEVTPLELRDPHLYHLDTALAALSDGTVLLCPDAFSPAALRLLERRRSVRRIDYVPRQEALDFGLNLVQVGTAVLVGGTAPHVQSLLSQRGFHPITVPLDQFQLAGGSAACLVAQVHRKEPATKTAQARVAIRATTAMRSACA